MESLVIVIPIVIGMFTMFWMGSVYGKNLKKEPKIQEMKCKIGEHFSDCVVHKCSTYGCLNCGQYVKKKV